MNAVSQLAAVEDDPLAHLRSGHPRLLLTDDGLSAALAAAKSDPLRAALHTRIIATAESLLGAAPLRHNDGKDFPEQERIAVFQILHCAMAYRLTGDERFATRAKDDLRTVAGFADWDQRHDLAVGEMSFAVAIGYDWLYGRLEPELRGKIKEALMKQALAWADAAYARGGSWTINTNNHNQVCNGGLVLAALALADEEPALVRRVLAGARASMLRALPAYAPDGGYPEGPGYWTYGTTYSAIAFAGLETALGTDLGLPEVPGFSRTIVYYEAMQGPSGAVFNFADCSTDLQNSPARAWLAERYRQPLARRSTRAQLADTLAHGRITPFDRAIQAQVVNRFFALHAVWFPGAVKKETSTAELPVALHFRGAADVAVLRSGWNDARALYVGFKAGENGASHGHLDLGSFVLDADGERWALDLGADVSNAYYDLPGYFYVKGGKRWTYFRTNNRSHNTVTPGDALQAPRAVAPIVAFNDDPVHAFAVADLTAAYPGHAASLHRGIALLDRSRVLVQDEFKPVRSETPLRWTMVTGKRIALGPDGRSALLTSDAHALRFEVLEPAGARLQLAPARPTTAAENQNEGATLLTVDVTPEPGISPTRIAVLLTPVGDNWPHRDTPTLTPLADWH